MSEQSNILDVLISVKETEGLTISDEVVKRCYEIQRKHQFDSERNTLNQMREIIEGVLDQEFKGEV